MTLAWITKNASKQYTRLKEKYFDLKQTAKQYNIIDQRCADPSTLDPLYVRRKIKKFALFMEEISKFFGDRCGDELAVAREYINEHLQKDPALYNVLYDRFNEAYVIETNKQILERQFDPDVALRRAISGVLNGETTRQALNYRKAVC